MNIIFCKFSAILCRAKKIHVCHDCIMYIISFSIMMLGIHTWGSNMMLILLPEDNLECILFIVISKHSLHEHRLNNGETSTGITSDIKDYTGVLLECVHLFSIQYYIDRKISISIHQWVEILSHDISIGHISTQHMQNLYCQDKFLYKYVII